MKAIKISDGVYNYKGYRLVYKGWDKLTQSYWWEATNVFTNCVEFVEHTMQEIIDDIEESGVDFNEQYYDKY